MLHGKLSIVAGDRRLEQSHIGVVPGKMIVVGHETFHPADVHVPLPDFRAAQQFQEQRFVTDATFDDHHAVPYSSPQTGKRFCAALTEGDDFGDHGVKLGRNDIAFRHTRVDSHARAGLNPEALNGAGCGSKIVVGIFGVQPHFNGVTSCSRWLSLQAAATRDMDLKLHEIEAGGAFRHGMLDLQPGIHLHEHEATALWLVQEFDGARIVITSGAAQAHGGVAQGLIQLRGKSRRGGLFEDFLVAALDGAITYAGGPSGPVVVGNDLDFHVARMGDKLLHKNCWISKSLVGFGAGALKGCGELVRGVNAANSVTTATGSGLDEEGIAEPFGMADGAVDRVDWPATPGSDGDLLCFG